MSHVSIHDAQSQLSQLIQKALQGEEIIIVKGKKPLVKLIPIYIPKGQRSIGPDKGLVQIADDFSSPIDDFEEYMV